MKPSKTARFLLVIMIICLLLVSVGVGFSLPAKAQADDLQISYPGGSQDIINIQEDSIINNQDGSITANLIIENKKAIFLNLDFEIQGTVTGNYRDWYHLLLYPKGKLQINLTFQPSSSIIIKLSKLGTVQQPWALIEDVSQCVALLTGGTFFTQDPVEGVIDIVSTLAQIATPTSFDTSNVINLVLQGKSEDALKSLFSLGAANSDILHEVLSLHLSNPPSTSSISAVFVLPAILIQVGKISSFVGDFINTPPNSQAIIYRNTPPSVTLTPQPPVPTFQISNDQATFIADVTIPDGTNILPGQAIQKIWRLRNDGSTTWDTTYSLVFIGGQQLDASTVVNLNKSVSPGQEIDIAVNMISPTVGGGVSSIWQLRNSSDTLFGDAVWLFITVSGNSLATSTPVNQANAIDFCDGSNFGYPCQQYTYSSNSVCINLTGSRMNNRIQSLRFNGNYAGDYESILYDDSNCSVYIARYGSDATDLGGLNNLTSSIRIEQLQPADCSTSSDGVTLYVNAGYQGHCHTFTPGSYPDLGQFGLDQNITSIKNPNGAFAIHFNDGLNFSGTPGHFDGDVYDLGPNGWSDRARSVQIEQHIPTSCNPGSDGAILYVDVNYGSGCITVTNDIPDLTPMTLDHALDSLRFVGSYKSTTQILIYRQANYVDLCGTYWQDQSDLRSCAGQAVSVKILPFTPPTPIPTVPGTLFSGNIAPNAFLYPYGTSSLVDGNLNTEWVGGHGSSSNVYLSWAAPVSIHRIVVWDRSANTGSNGINSLTLTFSDGTIATNIDMTSAGPRCADIRFPNKTVSWVGVLPWDTSGDNGFREIEVWATTGQQNSDNSCVMIQNVTPQSSSVSDPPIVATPIPGPTLPPITNLVVSTNPAESSDGQAHGATNPFIIPYNANYDSVTIKAGAYASATAWNGISGGKVRFVVTGTVLIEGTLTVDGKGNRGGAAVVGAGGGNQGESYIGYGSNSFGPNGGGGGGGNGPDSGGGGGGYGTAGQNAQNGAGVGTSYGGSTYGDPSISNLYLGSGGGSSGAQSGNFGGAGGAGGGAIFIQANSIIVTGHISANGADGKSAGASSNPRGGGGGSGGSILLRANTIDVGNGLVTALGGQGGYGTRDNGSPASGGAGGAGRIRLEYIQNPPSGTTNPSASVARFVTTVDLVVSTDPSESSDGQAHGLSNPYLIPLDASYHSVTIKVGAYATASAWNGNSGGTMQFTVTGLIQMDGTLTVAGLGYRGGPTVTGASNGKQGESYTGWGYGDIQPNGGGGGGGGGADSGGAGGGYGSQGQNAINGSDALVVYGGLTYGDSALTTLYLGSGGGSSGAQSANVGGAGGNGGGAISITAGQIIVSATGKIIADGANGTSAGSPANPRGGGGGSGGSILLRANIITINGVVSSIGGLGGYGIRENGMPAAGGNGGVGRIYIQYGQGLFGSTNPPAYTQHDPNLEPAPTFTPSPTLTNTPTPTSTNTPTPTPTSTPTRTPTPSPTATDSCVVTSGSWLTEYWNNENMSGYPTRCLNTDSINFEWYSGSPIQGIASDHFSARWTKYVNFDEGTYHFNVFHDDGARLYIDSNLVIDNWCDNCRETDGIDIPLSAGIHTVKLELHEVVGWSSVQLSWNKLDPAPVVISVIRAHPNPTNANNVNFTVTFSEPVTGVDMIGPTFDDFTLATSSSISGASVTSVSGSGTTYTVTVSTGSGNGTLRLDVVTGGSIVDLALNPLAGGFTTGEVYTLIKTATFVDVPLDYWAWSFIERLYNAGITGGCSLSPLMYCPETNVTRAQMAVFLLRGEHGSTYSPPAVGTNTGFTDVPLDYWAAAWIKQLAAEGITGGCGVGLYCPEASVTRDQMAVFLLRAEHGPAYSPPPATGVFTDVPTDFWAAAWIEQLAAEGITGGCGTGIYCPTTPVTRAQMAVFLVRAFNLP